MHESVLLKESIDALNLKKGDVFLDATLGAGGHSQEVFKRFKDEVSVYGIDADSEAILFSKKRFESIGFFPKLAVFNFRNIENISEIFGDIEPNAILFDLGWNKAQFDTPLGMVGRGFSFQKDEPLLMTFGNPKENDFTAYDVLNIWDEENIETILDAYGEEKFSRRIASKIVEERQKGPIKTSKQLSDIVYYAVPVWYRFKKIHPATRTFQAIRIAVNDELRSLEKGLSGAFKIMKKGGRLVVISFHSLEDRIVKRYFKDVSVSEKGRVITKKPIVADEEEEKRNPRSRSAKLRVLEKI